jgi:hypothetical protein
MTGLSGLERRRVVHQTEKSHSMKEKDPISRPPSGQSSLRKEVDSFNYLPTIAQLYITSPELL